MQGAACNWHAIVRLILGGGKNGMAQSKAGHGMAGHGTWHGMAHGTASSNPSHHQQHALLPTCPVAKLVAAVALRVAAALGQGRIACMVKGDGEEGGRHGTARHGAAWHGATGHESLHATKRLEHHFMHGWFNLAMQAGTGAWLLAPLKMSANSGRRHSWGSRPTSRATAPLPGEQREATVNATVNATEQRMAGFGHGACEGAWHVS